MAEDTWDLVVIGTGGAAMAAGIEARSRGRTVLLVEHGPLGGTCLNIGCIPSKHLLAAASHRHRAVSGRAFPMVEVSGGCGGPACADDAEAGPRRRPATGEVRRRRRRARLPGPVRLRPLHRRPHLEVDGEPVLADAYVVATGAAPHVPDLPGLDLVDRLDSTTAMELQSLPATMVVLGGGPVGLEQAQLWAHLGTEVTLVGRVALFAEPELADVLRRVFADDGIRLVEGRAVAVESAGNGVRVRTDGAEVTAERLLVATGRRAVTGGLGLEAAGIATDDRGNVVVDASQRTTDPRVFAAGDVAGAPQYVYVAAQTGRVAAAGALGEPSSVDDRGLPGVTFTTPQLASAGLTEEQARAAGHDCDCRVLGAQDIPRALADRDIRGALELVADAATGEVLGVHAALDGAGDVMLAATYAIKHGLTVDDLADTWAPYLTMGEALRIAAGLFRSDAPTSCCA